MIKWTWRFRNDGNSLWSKFIRAMYGSDGKLRKHVNRSHPSIWLDIVNEVHNLKNKNLDILSLMKKKIGNGSDTSFWEETWRGDHSFSTSFPRIFALEDDKSITVARKMAHDDLTFSLRRNPRDGAEAMQFSELKAILDGLLLSSAKDRWSWSIDGSEEFSVASTRRLLDDHLLQGTSVKTRWVKEVPIKINIMAWKVRFDYLPSRFNLSKRGLDILDICCPTCTHEAETTNHIFFSCTMVREIYLKIAHWWDVRYSNISSYEDWYDWLSNLKMHPKRRDNLEGVYGRGSRLSSQLSFTGTNSYSQLSEESDIANSLVFSSSSSHNKRSKIDVNGLNIMESELNFGLSESALEAAAMEKMMDLPHDSVPCKIRAKRGCATHPRSIAERERRTRISGKLKKLQDLVPNMDKSLHNELQNCTCGCKPE
ncbi:RNA-directed DNA polymerase, eukaryota, reverse transcriptase zinc-binding domain protein [Tanacetum coccineum]